MANEQKDKLPVSDPLIALTEEARQRLDNMDSDLVKSEKLFDAMDELGMDTTRQRERIAFARKARDTILKAME